MPDLPTLTLTLSRQREREKEADFCKLALVPPGAGVGAVRAQSIDNQRKHADPYPSLGVGARGTRLFAPSSAAQAALEPRASAPKARRSKTEATGPEHKATWVMTSSSLESAFRHTPHRRCADRVQTPPRAGRDQPAAGEFAEGGQHGLTGFLHKTRQAQAGAPRAWQPAGRMQMASQHEMRRMVLRVVAAGEGAEQMRLVTHVDAQCFGWVARAAVVVAAHQRHR